VRVVMGELLSPFETGALARSVAVFSGGLRPDPRL
jgi:hypothetical protein